MKDSYDISNQPEIFKWWSWSWGHFYGISMAFLTPPMTPHPMTGTSLGPEARLLVYFHWAFPCAATAGWEFVHKQKGSGWLSHVVTDNIYIYNIPNQLCISKPNPILERTYEPAKWTRYLLPSALERIMTMFVESWKHLFTNILENCCALKKAKKVEKGDEWSCYGYSCSSSSIHIMKTRIG